MKRIYVFGCVLVLSAMLSSLTGCHPKKVVVNKDLTDSLERITDPTSRIMRLDKLIKDNPENANLYMMRSKAYDEAGNLDLSLENAKKAIERDTTHADWYFYMADLFMKKPSVKNAIGTMERFTLGRPNDKMAWVKLGELYLKSGIFNEKEENGNNKKSLESLDKAIKLDHNLPEAYFWIGYNYRDMKKDDKAIAAFQKAIELKPDYEDAYVILGLLYEAKKDPKAEEYFSSAIRINPKDSIALYDRGKYNQDRDSFDRAIVDYQKILELDPNKRSANYAIGYCLYQEKKYNDALGYFSKVLLNNPKDAAAHDGRSLCYRGLGETEKANKEKEIAERLYNK